MDNQVTEEYAVSIGWQLVKQYDHDQFHTNRYKLGYMELEFTYEGDKLCTCDITISEVNCLPVSQPEFEQLTRILGKCAE